MLIEIYNGILQVNYKKCFAVYILLCSSNETINEIIIIFQGDKEGTISRDEERSLGN